MGVVLHCKNPTTYLSSFGFAPRHKPTHKKTKGLFFCLGLVRNVFGVTIFYEIIIVQEKSIRKRYFTMFNAPTLESVGW